MYDPESIGWYEDAPRSFGAWAVFKLVRTAWNILTLVPLPEQRFELVTWREAKVHPDTHVMFEKAMYSVPWPLIGKQVLVRAKGNSVYVYTDDERVAIHRRGRPGQRMTIEAHLPRHRRELRHRNRSISGAPCSSGCECQDAPFLGIQGCPTAGIPGRVWWTGGESG